MATASQTDITVTGSWQDIVVADSDLASVGLTGGATLQPAQNLAWDEDLARYVIRATAASTSDIDLFFQINNSGTGGVCEFGEVEVVNLTKLRER